MRMIELIAKKRDGGEHTPEELAFIARCAAEGSCPDYQLSAWLMAVVLKGMSEREAAALTRAMCGAGAVLSSSGPSAPRVDKHSTGGVGDGISIALAPLAAAAGVVVPMMSGRGLGHTGGTLDKLESIRGFEVRLDPKRIDSQLRSIGVCLFGQSDSIAPADRKLYALRDATETVQSIPLIVASILSKKLAEGLDGLVLDVKLGSGAIFPDKTRAKKLARALVAAAKRLELKCVGIVTAMRQPLGRAVGGALELKQAIAVLRGDRSAPDYLEVLLELGGWMLVLAGRAKSRKDGALIIQSLIDSGAGAQKLKEIIQAQGGDPAVVDRPEELLPQAPHSRSVFAEKKGFVAELDARAIGLAGLRLGFGREKMDDAIDPGAGIALEKKIGDPVEPGDALARLYAADEGRLDAAERLVQDAYSFSKSRRRPGRTVLEVFR